ncbi:MAG: hypothetical protein WA962_14355 [Ornithinimicrobium sp.]
MRPSLEVTGSRAAVSELASGNGILSTTDQELRLLSPYSARASTFWSVRMPWSASRWRLS